MTALTTKGFVADWGSCTRCPLHKEASKHVLFRGNIPADVLFVGEAPGKTENRLGKPFVGRSGLLLESALDRLGLSSFCICNVVCCIPWLDRKAEVVRPPSRGEAEACSPHLTQIAQLCKAKLIVCLGNEAKKHFPTKNFCDTPLTFLRHPAYILRNGGESSLEFKRFLGALHSALNKAGIPCNAPFSEICYETICN